MSDKVDMPMCMKLSAKRPTIQTILQFLEWLHDEKKGELAVRDEHDRLERIAMYNEQLVYEYLGIDETILEKERRALLARVRQAQGDTEADDAPKES